jgi:8-amino-7-oxononanoate synthase
VNFSFIEQQLQSQKTKHRYRQRLVVNKNSGREIQVAGKSYLNFSSNDYLGLNNHPDINKALQQGADKYGTCATASNLITGFNFAHQALEESICTWLNKPRCLLFNSGFSANVGILTALANDDTQFWLDKLCHASLIDGALTSKAKVKRYFHNDYQQLNSLLENKSAQNNLIVSEGVFSMDGDQSDTKRLLALAKQHDSWLYLDDAHSIGVIGEQGKGSSSYGDIDIVMATMGKALATSGAFVACDESLYQYLVNFSRHYMYSTAISPAIAWATKASIDLVQKENWRRQKIKSLSELFTSLVDPTIKVIPSNSSIHAIVLGDEKKALICSEQLKQKGIWLTAIRPPTVPLHTSRLRVTLCASHNESDINYLANNINEIMV